MRSKHLLAMALFMISAIAFAKSHAYKTGKLVNVTTDERLNDGTSFRRAILTVQVDGISYTLQGERVNAHTKDYANGLIIGDPIQASVEGSNVYLLKPDGKNMKTAILKRERVSETP